MLSAALISGCIAGGNDLPKGSDLPAETDAAAAGPIPEALQTAIPTPASAFTLPQNLRPISAENAQAIHELASVYPYFPPYYHFSNDGVRYATGDMQKVEIRETATGELVSSIPAVLPDCDFGFDRYFRLNMDGTFIALVNGQSIQVWQSGGGLIYESPILRELTSNAPACGADLPELSLSPDGRLLAISGIAYAKTSARRYFRVVDVRANEILYEWDGAKGDLHGNFYTFYGLGFSDDGLMLQTFDPTRFIRTEGEVHKAFRFWSVENWQEVEAADDTVLQRFKPGQLLFPSSDSGQIVVLSRITGKISSRIPMDDCLWDAPCETRISDDGALALVLDPAAGQFLYKNDALNASITIWDLAENKEVGRESGVFRDLESVLIKDDGNLARADQAGNGNMGSPVWWTFRDNFTGLQTDADGTISFTPMSAAAESSQSCQFCAVCSIDTEKGAIECSQGITDNEDGRITLKSEGGEFSAIRQDETGETILGELVLPEAADKSKTRVRLLGYSLPHQTLFYCADEAQRQKSCFIYDPYQKEIIEKVKDISYLRLSADGRTAAFFNRTVNALFHYDLSSKILTRKSPYQSRGYPVNAVFSSDGKMFQYIIQNLNNTSDLSVETLDAETWKSYGRTSIRKAGVISPTVFLESGDGRMWAFAGKSGEAWLLSPDKGVLLHRFQAHLDDIIGMALAPDSTWLLTMGENGILKFWGIEQ